MFASGCFAKSPNSSKSLDTCCSLVKNSGKVAAILPARDISLVSILIPEDLVKAFTIGKKDSVANAGASSVLV